MRMDVAEQAVFSLAESLRLLGISGWHLPDIREKFIELQDNQTLELGRLGKITETEAEIIFDARFKNQESQMLFEEELRLYGIDFNGMASSFKRQLAHLVMWSVTGLRHQPAVRLIDQGWATLIEHLGTENISSISKLIQFIKIKLLSIKNNRPDHYHRCLDLYHPVSERIKEDLQDDEGFIGAGLLLWIYESQGLEAMIDLIRKSPSTSRRTSTDYMKIPADLRPLIHTGYTSYQQNVVAPLRRGNLSYAEAQTISDFARRWEAEQFQSAITEITQIPDVQVIINEFEKWIEE